MRDFELFNALPTPVRVLDSKGQVVFANERAQEEGLAQDILCIRDGTHSACEQCLKMCEQHALQNAIVQVRDQVFRVDQRMLTFNNDVFLVETFTDVTELHTAQKREAEAKRDLETRLETATIGYIDVDPNFCLEKVNPNFATLLEYSPDELVGMSLFNLATPEGTTELLSQIKKRENEKNRSYKTRLRTKSGKEKIVEITATTHTGPNGEQRSFAFVKDITQQELDIQKIEEQMRQLSYTQAELQQIIESVPVGIAVLDQYLLSQVNANFFGTLGYTPEESTVFMGKSIFNHKLFTSNSFQKIITLVEELLTSTVVSGELWLIHKDGGEIPVEVRLSFVDEGETRKTFIVIQDISERKALESERKAHEEELNKLATTDALTHLPNRRSLTEFLTRVCETAVREKSEVTTLFIDADHFKKVNDTHGHRAGDEVLKTIAETLVNTIRGKGQDMAARLGGEEFVVALSKMTKEQALKKAEEIRRKIETTQIQTQNKEGEPVTINITASIGVAFGNNAETLLSVSDKLLYEAKAAGRNCTCFESESGEIETFQTA